MIFMTIRFLLRTTKKQRTLLLRSRYGKGLPWFVGNHKHFCCAFFKNQQDDLTNQWCLLPWHDPVRNRKYVKKIDLIPYLAILT